VKGTDSSTTPEEEEAKSSVNRLIQIRSTGQTRLVLSIRAVLLRSPNARELSQAEAHPRDKQK
jgi:hypothetical protein